MKTNQSLATLTFCLLVSASLNVMAIDEYNVSNGITAAGIPLGLHRVNAVALTSLPAVAESDAAFTVAQDANTYYFASQNSADQFSDDQQQFGGYCAFAVSLGKKFDGDPMFADIVGGKLYLFVNDTIYNMYLDNKEETLTKAAQVWPSILHKAVRKL